MTGVATAIGVGAAATVGASVYAANKQAGSASNAQRISQNQYQDTVARNAPFTQAGVEATGALQQGLGLGKQNDAAGAAGVGYGSLTKPFTTEDWKTLSPAYNFELQQGQQGVRNADASGQGALSGSALKDLTDYNQSLANTSFNSAFNQYQTQQGNIFNRLSGIANLGQNSANNTGAQGTALAGQAAQSAQNIGTAQAGGAVGAANAISGGASSLAGWLAYKGNSGGVPDLNAGGGWSDVNQGSVSGGQFWPG